jgi:hypothetical protein
MTTMKPSAASQASGGRDPVPAPRTDATQTGKIEKPYGDHYHKPVITPGMLKSPIFPVWLTSRLSKLFRRATSTH